MKFKTGQEVTPNRKNVDWIVTFGNFESKNFPEFGKVYTVIDYPMPPPWQFMVRFVELGEKFVFNEDGFDPLVSIDQLEEDLNEVDHDLKVITKLADG